MTTRKQTLILTIALFILATRLTMKQELMVDGRNEYGFPFRFWTISYDIITAPGEQNKGATFDIYIPI
jgi:hypothetical protein